MQPELENQNIISDLKYKAENLDWSTRRKFLYFTGFFLVVLFYIIYKLFPIIFPDPTCFDKKQNSLETGIDCGGTCSLQCKNTYKPLNLILQKSFVGTNGTSDILVLFENNNKNISPYKLSLDIDIYDKEGKFVETIHKEEITGTQKYIPIFIDNYKVEKISKVFVKNIVYEMYTNRGAYDVALTDYNFSEDKMTLDLKLKNIYKEDLKDSLKVYVLVRDKLNNIIAVNYQTLAGINYDETKTLNFLWPEAIEGDIKNIDVFVISNLYF